jgi:Transposase, Mutator family
VPRRANRRKTRVSYRSGYYGRSLITRVGTLELRVPQDRLGRFSTDLFERYQRSEKALVGTLGRDVRARGFDAEGEGGERGVVWAQLFGLGDQRGQQIVGRGIAQVRRPTAERAVSLSDPGCALREGAGEAGSS